MNKKIFFSSLLTLILLTTQVIAAGAAPIAQENPPTIEGTIQSITIETDEATGVTNVIVISVDEAGTSLTVEFSLEEALSLGLVVDDGTGNYVANETMLPVEDEEDEHPVASALADFFMDTLGVDYDMVMEYHEDGAGFGVIAQALWMTNTLDGDSTLFSTIMDAKINHDYSSIELPDGSTPTNWGQFRKAVMSGDEDSTKKNLGVIKSGHANDSSDDGEKPGHSGEAHGKDGDTGKPDTPPGQEGKEPKPNKPDKKNK